ncbi:MAG: hypothetical protein ABIY71_03715 [Flavobacteriales bacterium]
MLRTLILSSLLAGSALSCLHAQAPGKTEWSNVPFNENGRIPTSVRTAYCAEGGTYALAEMVSGKNEYVGYIFPKNGPAVSRVVELPDQKAHISFSAFCLMGNTPCVVYNTWEKETGLVTLFAQAYTAADFTPEGAPVKLGEIPLSRSYQGSAIDVRTTPSPDGSKMLFLFDDIQQGGIKYALCWVTDRDLNPLWSGQYQIPVQSRGSKTTSYLMDDGRAYMSVRGVSLNEENVKEKKDGSVEAKTKAAYWKHSEENWYSMFGEEFHQWDCTVPELRGVFEGTPLMRNGQVVMAGLMLPEVKKGEQAKGTYVLLSIKEGFTPEVIKSGAARSSSSKGVRAMEGENGNIFLAVFQEKEMTMLKLDATGELQWERTSAHATKLAKAVGDRVIINYYGSQGALNDLHAGKTPKASANGNFFPIMFVWDAEGNTTAQRIFPEDAQVLRLHDWDNTFDDCGCYVALSTEKKRPGLVRMCVEN